MRSVVLLLPAFVLLFAPAVSAQLDSILKETLRDKIATEEFVDLAVQLLVRER